MNTLEIREVHPAFHVRELHQRPEFSTCYECHRSFQAKCEDQLSLELCDHCFDDLRHLRESIISVRVKARAHRAGAR